MVRYPRIPAKPWQPENRGLRSLLRWSILAGPNPAFGNLVYDLVIDHHPRTDLTGFEPDAFVDIRLDVGATSSMMTCLPRPRA